MKLNISPAIRLSFGLVLLTVSILSLAKALGLTPNTQHAALAARQQQAESIAYQSLFALSRNDIQLMKSMLEDAVQHGNELLSAGVRYPTGDLVYTSAQHRTLWRPAERIDIAGDKNQMIRVPLKHNNVNRGTLELVFAPINVNEPRLFGLSNAALLTLFICCSTFFSFFVFIKKALRHLDPNAVIPARVKNAMNVLAEGVIIIDKREQIMMANAAFMECLNIDETRILGRRLANFSWKVDSETTMLPWQKCLADGNKATSQRLEFEQEDQHIVFKINVVPIHDEKNQLQGAIVSFNDVTQLEQQNTQLEKSVAQLRASQVEIREKSRRLAHLASIDPLTNCYNRRVLQERLIEEFTKSRENGTSLICMMLDIDHFKKVNDNYGHNLGDKAIRMVADTVKKRLRKTDILARFGGEEFCVLLPGISIVEAKAIANRCRFSIEKTAVENVNITSSFGLAVLTPAMTKPEDLVKKADESLYHAKSEGRNRVSFENVITAANEDTIHTNSQRTAS